MLADGLSLALERARRHRGHRDAPAPSSAALGKKVAGVLGNDQGWVDQILGASTRTDERAWQLPSSTTTASC